MPNQLFKEIPVLYQKYIYETVLSDYAFAVTINPDKNKGTDDVLFVRLVNILNRNTRYWLCPETANGRLHYHGVVRLRKNNFYILKAEIDREVGFSQFKSVFNHGWLNYCFKEFTKIPYFITNNSHMEFVAYLQNIPLYTVDDKHEEIDKKMDVLEDQYSDQMVIDNINSQLADPL